MQNLFLLLEVKFIKEKEDNDHDFQVNVNKDFEVKYGNDHSYVDDLENEVSYIQCVMHLEVFGLGWIHYI